MQIELIGCTSAGKSTLSRNIRQAGHAQGLDIVAGDDFVLRQIRLDWIKSHLPRTFWVDLLAMIACLVTWPNNFKFYRFAAQLLFELPIPRFEKLNLLRNVLKKIGIYEIIRFRSTNRQIILVDEGVLQAAHNLFVHGSVQVKTENVSTFAGLIPLPDLIVYLRQPESLLIERTLKRGHKRIHNHSYSHVVPFIKQAVTIFDTLVQNPAIESRLLVVESGHHVTLAPPYQAEPSLGLALKIIQNGLAVESYESVQARL